MDVRDWCLTWHRSKSKLQLRDLLTLLSTGCLLSHIFAWFCCLPPPAVTSGTWRNRGRCPVWLPNEWFAGTHATAQWRVLPARQLGDSLVAGSGQERVRRLGGCCPSFWGEVGTKTVLPLSERPWHWVRRGAQRRKEEEGRSCWKGPSPSQKGLGGTHSPYLLPGPYQARSQPPNSSKNLLGFTTDTHSLGEWQLVPQSTIVFECLNEAEGVYSIVRVLLLVETKGVYRWCRLVVTLRSIREKILKI